MNKRNQSGESVFARKEFPSVLRSILIGVSISSKLFVTQELPSESNLNLNIQKQRRKDKACKAFD